MFSPIYYKEWLKLRWAFFIVLGFALLMDLNIYLNVSHDIIFIEPKSYLFNLIFRGVRFYSGVQYVPLLSGIVLAIAQFYPEMHSDRLKLTFHLPLNENQVLLQMVSLGALLQLVISAVMLVVLMVITAKFFPAEVVSSVTITVLPWILAGFVGYFATAMILIEPLWKVRIILMLIFYGFVGLFYFDFYYNTYARSWPFFLVLTLFHSVFILYSGYRFRRGVR